MKVENLKVGDIVTYFNVRASVQRIGVVRKIVPDFLNKQMAIVEVINSSGMNIRTGQDEITEDDKIYHIR